MLRTCVNTTTGVFYLAVVPFGGWAFAPRPSTMLQIGGRVFAVSQAKLEELRHLIRSFGSCLVAYSGGVDSVFLARVARDVLGDRSLAVIADSPSLPRREFDDAVAIARQFEIPLEVVRPQSFSNAHSLSTPSTRCSLCKHELFAEPDRVPRLKKI